MSYQLDDPGNAVKFYQSSAEPPIRLAARAPSCVMALLMTGAIWAHPALGVWRAWGLATYGQSAVTTRSCLFVRRCELSAKLVGR